MNDDMLNEDQHQTVTWAARRKVTIALLSDDVGDGGRVVREQTRFHTRVPQTGKICSNPSDLRCGGSS